MKRKVLIISAALALILAGCTGQTNTQSDFVPGGNTSQRESSEGVHPQSVSLDKESLEMEVGQTATLVATVLPSDADDKTVLWSASGDGVVSVDDGVVKALKAGQAVVTARTRDGGHTATCNVTVKDEDEGQKPEGAVDLEYSTADNLASHGDNWVYFNDPEWWSGASARVNEAYVYNEKVVFDYTYLDRDDPNAACENWTVQLMRKNTSLTKGKVYDLSFKMKSDKAGKVIVNDMERNVVEGVNEMSLVVTEGDGPSINIQFPLKMIGSARVILSDVKWVDHTEGGGENPDKPEGAVDLEYSTADTLNQHGDNWCYFNDPSWWSGASARVNEAYTYNETVVFDYTYLDRDNPSAPYDNWTVQLMRKNTSLTKGTTYDLSLKMNSNKAGKVILNDVEKTVTVGDNTLSLTYTEGDAASINIQFPMGMIGSARVVLSEVKWSAQGQGGGGEQGGGEQGGGESSIAAPEGVVVNPVDGGYIVAFAAVAGATGYKAYYVDSNGQDVDNEVVTNGGRLTKVDSLADGEYKVYVTSLKDDQESARSTSFGTLIIGETDKDPVAPVGVVVNAIEGGYIVAFAGVAGATGYKAYYVDSNGQDVANEEVTNGGKLTKVDSLPAGTYKVYVSTLIGEKESPRSESFGTFTK